MRSFLVISVGFGLFGMVFGAAGEACAQGWTDDGTVVRLTTKTDSVGIGTDLPTDKLHVIGNARIDGKVVTGIVAVPGSAMLQLRIGGRDALRLTPTKTSPNIIGGSEVNVVDPAVVGATIAGGGDPNPLSPNPNVITDNYGTIGGGRGNQAGDAAGTADDARSATVGGGEDNTASAAFATVGGGFSNAASNQYSTVGGGDNNLASGFLSTVAGGSNNVASGYAATVGGGEFNVAAGNHSFAAGNNVAAGNSSFAAGHRAKANHNGTFVWADAANFDFGSQTANQFRARATGGAQFVSAVNISGGATAGVALAAGGNSWASISDRTLKDNITPIDGRDVVRRLAAIPITQWNLKAQDPTIKHLGPMAQDFYAAFGLGEDERYINSADADGIALVSIQALYQILTALEQKTAALEQKTAELGRIADNVEDLRARLARFERAAERPR
jgi:hypothetical protein